MAPLLALCLAVFGCASPAPEPSIVSVQPSRGWTGEPTAVTIAGESLLPVVSLGSPDPVSGDFEAWLLADPPVRLDGVSYADAEHLLATVPAGVEPGLYGIEVRTPGGGEATRAESFRVTQTRADHLSFVAASAAFDLGESAEIYLELRDPDDGLVAEAMEVEVLATSHAAAGGLVFDSTLAEQRLLADGTGVSGRLDPDGRGLLRFASTQPDDVTLELRSLTDESITGDETVLSWDTGGLADLTIRFPFSPFVANVGEPFDVELGLFDEFGNALVDTYARVLLTDGCSDLREIVDVVGSATVTLTLLNSCPVNRIYALNQAVEVESEPFEVLAGEVAGFTLIAAPDEVTAGVDPVLVLVQAVDAYGNAVDDYAGPVTLTDDVGGYDAARSNCPDLENGVALCSVYLNIAANPVRLVATDASARTGESNVIVVTPGVPDSVLVTLMDVLVAAGQPFGVTIEVVDAWGNPIAIEPGGADPVVFQDDTATITCAWTGPVSEVIHAFSCSVTGALTGNTVEVAVPSQGVEGVASDPLDVVNDALAVVSFTTPTNTVAGQAFTFGVSAFDQYGNAYLAQSDPIVDLADSTGTLDTANLALDALGGAVATASVTAAASDVRLIASRAGVELGRSDAIEVGAGTMSGFTVATPPWAVAGEGASVKVAAIDTFGNITPTYLGVVDVTATSGCESATTVNFTAGIAEVSLVCDAAVIGSVVTAVDTDGNRGESPLFDIVDLSCGDGPVADLVIEGEVEPILCLAAESLSVSLDASGSADGAAPISVYHFVDSDGGQTRTSLVSANHTWVLAGAREVQMLAVDENACADAVTGWAWVGLDDGSPTGPVELVLSASTVTTSGTVAVAATAEDCTGDVAAGQTLIVRSDLGDVTGTATGSGLVVTLDGTGEAVFDWSFSAGYIGSATIFAGTASASSYGEATLPVTQDASRPHVLAVTPTGRNLETIDEIIIVFDEAILASTVANVAIVGPDGPVSVDATLVHDTLTLVPPAPIDGALGSYTLTVGSNVRDEAGNRLDGMYSGAASDFTAAFGNVPDNLPLAAGCGLDVSVLIPDGDPGAASEADVVTLTPIVGASPSRWWLEVTDAAGDHIRGLRTAGTAGTVSWDARADDGFVSESGSYLLVLNAVDAQGNVGEVCAESVRIEQHVELP